MKSRQLRGGHAYSRRGFLVTSLLGLATACRLSTGESPRSQGQSGIPPAAALADDNRTPIYESHETERATMHLVRVPGDGPWQVVPRVAEGLLPLPQFAGAWDGEGGAIALINAGFFDPANQLTTSVITRNGTLVADPRQNPRLMENPELTAYLGQILNRSEVRRLACGGTVRYGIARHQDAIPQGCQTVDALGAGPQLLPTLELEREGFRSVVNGQVVRDALGSDRPNARSAIGITATGDILLVMAAQRSEAPQQSGVSLTELAQFLTAQGAVEALNLDGGSSAGLRFQDRVFYGRVDASGQRIQRPIKSVLAVVERSR